MQDETVLRKNWFTKLDHMIPACQKCVGNGIKSDAGFTSQMGAGVGPESKIGSRLSRKLVRNGVRIQCPWACSVLVRLGRSPPRIGAGGCGWCARAVVPRLLRWCSARPAVRVGVAACRKLGVCLSCAPWMRWSAVWIGPGE